MPWLRCPRCAHTFEADPRTARCPKCGWAPQATGMPIPAPPRPPVAPPSLQTAPPLPRQGTRTTLGAWALALALLPLGLYVVGALASALVASSGTDSRSYEPSAFFSVFQVLSLAAAVAGIAMGVVARRDPQSSPRGRALALAAIITGSIVLGLYVLLLILIALVVAACAGACGSAASSSHGSCTTAVAGLPAPCSVGLVAVPGAPRRPALRDAFAHHPDLPALRADVFRVAGLRLCVGCFTAYPVFLAVLAAAWLWPVPAPVAWGAGLPLAALQLVSTLGWTRWRWLKVAVKACLGVGAALLVHAVLAAPWPPLVKSLAVAAGGLAALASAQPRLARIARLQAAAASQPS